MNCLFCKIVAKEISSKKVYEDDKIYAFEDIDPKAPIHILIIPKKHINSIDDANEETLECLNAIMLKIPHIAKEFGLSKKGYRVVTNVGEDGGQSVEHLHFHLLGGRQLQWPPG